MSNARLNFQTAYRSVSIKICKTTADIQFKLGEKLILTTAVRSKVTSSQFLSQLYSLTGTLNKITKPATTSESDSIYDKTSHITTVIPCCGLHTEINNTLASISHIISYTTIINS